MSRLYQMDRYVAPFEYLINYKILEYDIEKANISILMDTGILDESQYLYFKDKPKQEREISIGYLIKNRPELSLVLQKGIAEARRIFLSKNNIDDKNVLFINNDSITLVYYERNYDYTKIDGTIFQHTNFRLKNSYTSFYRLPYIDFLYYNDGNNEYYRLKNITQDKLIEKHEKYFLSMINGIAYEAQNSSILDTILLIKNMYKMYANMDLEIEYYREFNVINKYKIKDISQSMEYYTDILDYGNIDKLDIGYNSSILRLLYRIFINEYFKSIEK